MNRFLPFFDDMELFDTIHSQLLRYAIELEYELDEIDENQPRRGGSVVGRRVINRDHALGHKRLFNDYFSETPLYGDKQFRRRFRMSRPLFFRILDDAQSHDDYFLQKVAIAIRQLACGTGSDSADDYVKIGGSTAVECLKHFCKAVVEIYGEEYLRNPNEEDVERLLAMGEQRGLPGMLGSVGCVHGQYKGKGNRPKFIIEAIASQDLWIWHAFFDLPGALNDTNVLDRSAIFSALSSGNTPKVEFTINGNRYNRGYYLADGKYPNCATLVKTISAPQTQKKMNFAEAQEAARKDVDRALDVLQARFAIVQRPAPLWKKDDMHTAMNACIILHNMTVEDERDENLGFEFDGDASLLHVSRGVTEEGSTSQFHTRYMELINEDAHNQIQNDLVEHLWLKQTEQ